MEGTKLKALKQIFPELRNFEGRFFGLFLADLASKVEDWAIWARLELGKKKCFNIYTKDIACRVCKHFHYHEGDYCDKHSNLGQNFGDEKVHIPNTLIHPNTGEWYWCIKECPDFEEP